MVGLNRRRGGEEGIYRCEIPDSTNVPQTIYIGVYRASASTGEYTVHFYSTVVILLCCSVLCCRRYSVIEYAVYEMPCVSELNYIPRCEIKLIHRSVEVIDTQHEHLCVRILWCNDL